MINIETLQQYMFDKREYSTEERNWINADQDDLRKMLEDEREPTAAHEINQTPSRVIGQHSSRSSPNYMLLFVTALILIVADLLLHVDPEQAIPKANIAEQSSQNIQEHTQTQISPNGLPQILWVFTERDLNHSEIIDTVFGHHLEDVGLASGFEVRLVNTLDSQSAFKWLTPATRDRLTTAMRRSRYDVEVSELLRVALMIDHGGVMLRTSSAILIQKLQWLNDIFRKKWEGERSLKSSCWGKQPTELFLFHEKKNKTVAFLDFFLAARKQSQILGRVFEAMIGLLESAVTPFKDLSFFEKLDTDSQSKYLPNLLTKMLNEVLRDAKENAPCDIEAVESMQMKEGPTKYQTCFYSFDQLLVVDQQKAVELCGLKMMIFALDKEPSLHRILLDALQQGQQSIITHQNSIIRKSFFEVAKNKWIFTPTNPKWEVEFCIVSLKGLEKYEYQSQIDDSLKALQLQSYKRWKAVYFANDTVDHSIEGSNAVVIDYANSEGLDLRNAVIKHCPRRSIALLLNYDESITSTNGLLKLAEEMSDRKTFGAFIPLLINDKEIVPQLLGEVMRKQFSPNKKTLETIDNHFRVFSCDFYRTISESDLHNVEGKYYGKIVPLLAMLELTSGSESCLREEFAYQIRRVERTMDFPQRRLNFSGFSIETSMLQESMESNFDEPEFNLKFHYLSLCRDWNQISAAMSLNNFDDLFVLNEAQAYLGPQERQHLPKVIPTIIHHIWFHGEIPAQKKAILHLWRQYHPHFTQIIWTEKNITRVNFPRTFDMLQHLLEFNEVSSYSKFAAMADLIRYEAVYNMGGFYADMNYVWLGKTSLEDWRTFKLVYAAEIFPRQRTYKSMSFFGAEPKNPHILRLVSPESLSTIRKYLRETNLVTGPAYFNRIVVGAAEEADPHILQTSMEELYPYYPIDNKAQPNVCWKENVNLITSDIVFIKDGRGFSKSCSQKYPGAYGIYLYDMCFSWGKPIDAQSY